MEVFASLAAFLGISYPGALLATGAARRPAHALIIHCQAGACDPRRVFELEHRIRRALAKTGAGEYDGYEATLDGNEVFLYFYGPDAEQLFQVVGPLLEQVPFMRGAEMKQRFGPAAGGAGEVRRRIGS